MTIVSHIGLTFRDENLRKDLRGRSWSMLMKKDCKLYTLAFGHFVVDNRLDFPRPYLRDTIVIDGSPVNG